LPAKITKNRDSPAGVPADFVKPAQVPKRRDGYLVISATRLMAPQYQWLRETHNPLTRIGNLLFVYELPPSTSRPRVD
jgi:hypothetical protein